MGIILYDTLWTSAAVFFRLIERLLEVWNLVGLIWACPRTDAMTLPDMGLPADGRYDAYGRVDDLRERR
jgi:hypothetical protein